MGSTVKTARIYAKLIGLEITSPMLASALNSKPAWFVAFGVFQLILLWTLWNSQGGYLRSTAKEAWPTNAPAMNATEQVTGDKQDLFNDITNRTLGFQQIFVINLPKRTDLRDSMALASAMTELDFQYIDGVNPADIDRKTLPPGATDTNIKGGSLGCWRAHLDTLRTIVERNISSALILEADADWDIRIKSQLQDFSKASRILLQPLRNSTDAFLDPTSPRPKPDDRYTDFVLEEVLKTTTPVSSPYGDLERWDVLWLGHCGMKFPEAVDENVPLGRVTILDDETVFDTKDLDPLLGTFEFSSVYPPHTRTVSRARMNTCTSAYAVSLPGARRLLWEYSVHMSNAPIDMLLRSACHGSEGRELRTCLSVQPMLFNFHRPAGNKAGFSDIDDFSGEVNLVPYSPNIRWSTKINLGRLVDGRTDFLEHGEEVKMES